MSAGDIPLSPGLVESLNPPADQAAPSQGEG